LRSTKCAGLYIWKDKGQSSFASLVVVKRNKEKKCRLSSLTSNNLSEIVKEVPRGIPIIVALDGSNVIHKILPEKVSADQQVSMALPGAKAKDFFLCRQPIIEGRIIISLVRNSEIEQLVKDLNSAGLLIWDITLGPFALAEIPDVFADSERINIPYYSIKTKNDELLDFVRILHNPSLNSSIMFDDNVYSIEHLVPLANCLRFFSGSWKLKSSSLLDTQRKEYRAKKLLDTILLPFLLLVFASLLFNFFLFMNYEKEKLTLENVIFSKSSQLMEIDSLKKVIITKQQIFDTKRNNNAKYLSYFSDRIGSVVPQGIRLQEMVINPQLKTSRAASGQEFEKNRISITGITDNTISLEVFVKRLSSFKWIKNTSIISFMEAKDGVKSFILDLELSNL
jgi:Tfp pilus assembly protein PilN